MKKLIVLLLALSMLVTFFGCSSSKHEEAESDHVEEADAEAIEEQPNQMDAETDDSIAQNHSTEPEPIEPEPEEEPEKEIAVSEEPEIVQATPSATYSASNIADFYFDYVALAAELAPEEISASVSALSDGVIANETDNLRDFSVTASDQSLYHFLVDIDGSIEMIIAVIPNESYSEYLITSLVHLHSGIDTDILAADISELLPLVINNGENQSENYTNYALILSPLSDFTMVTAVFSESYQSDEFYATRLENLIGSIAVHVGMSN